MGVGLGLYVPWQDVWTNFEGFHLHAPLAYGFLWSPPRSVFPAPRTLDGWRLGEEFAVWAGLGSLVYWLLGRGDRR